ncbi:hypothetical protein Plec18167_009133 [Paecilomyces lecythidis]|uniref:Alcohol dehydrogenase n=1 Tax=Paecilomyces lecythidis TaxID=3004212 RepID=A0ABR3WRH5_9EURO
MTDSSKHVVLHLGDPIKYNKDLYEQLAKRYIIIQPSTEERQRTAFLKALRTRKWGNFSAIMRPFWATGGEMGRWDAELVPLLPESLKVFASAGAGYDWADVDLLAERSVLYCNGATASSEAVADMAIYHIISVFRNMQWSNLAARSGNPNIFLDAHINSPFTAHNPRGHVLGVVGLGSIGYTIAQKAYAAFGMKIIYYDPFPKSAEQEAAVGAVRVPDLDDMVAQADCVVLAAPGSSGLVMDAARIARMKRGSRLVNVSRGNLVDSNAVADSMESGYLFAVGLDVHEEEPNVNPRLLAMRNATLTCHTAGGALETTIGFERLAMENVLAVLQGGLPLTPVNRHLMKQT